MLRQSSRVLLPSNYRTSVRSVREISKTSGVSSKKEQKEYLEQHLPADLFKIVMETKTTDKHWLKVVDMTVFDKIQTYKADYAEKNVLLDQTVADKISQSVLTHSRGDKKTTFFDGEGGLCHIAARVSQFDMFKDVCVLEKDLEGLESLNGYVKDPSIPVYDVNLTKIAADAMDQKQMLIPSLLKYLPPGEVSEDVPSFTIVATATQGVVKYLTNRMLFRDNPFGEFYSSRPEFFFIVTARTYFHLCCGFSSAEPERIRVTEEEMRAKNKQFEKKINLTLHYNVLFQVLCDFCLVDYLPRKAFFPWKKHKRHNKQKMISNKARNDQLYEANQDRLMLIYVRPRKPAELGIGNPKYLDFFLAQILKSKRRKIVELFEDWSTGWGFVVVESGYTIISEVRDLDLDELMTLYKVLTAIPDFEHSNFVAEAADYHSAIHENATISDQEMEQFRITYKRKMNIGEDYYETEG